jgi:hypothetical protein
LAQKGEEDEDEENGVDFLTKPQPVSKAVNHQKDVVNNNVICKTADLTLECPRGGVDATPPAVFPG